MSLIVSKARILIVEDETIIAMGIEDCLYYSGYEICKILSTAEQAVEEIEAIHPDLVLMDVMLAGTMTGIEAAEYITQQYQTPIIFLTALNDICTLKRIQQTNSAGYLTKPCDEQHLISTVERVLAQYRH